jgi:pimeloyl-ACP methyl ester carboxylesterase
MPITERGDGVRLSWRTAGEGPLVVITDNLFSIPEVLDELEADLAEDHTVLRYHPRGVGDSTRRGPYDFDTDVADLAAILDAVGAGAVAVGPANGSVVAALCAVRHPDLVEAVVAPTGVPIATAPLGDGLAGSQPVLKAIRTQLESDYRGTLRSVTTLGNPQDSEEQHRERVEALVAYCPQEAAVGRFDAWFHADTTEESRALGDRLWVLLHPGMPWWPAEMADPLREALPEAHVEVVEDGPLSRPDIVAGVVRRITGGKP